MAWITPTVVGVGTGDNKVQIINLVTNQVERTIGYNGFNNKGTQIIASGANDGVYYYGHGKRVCKSVYEVAGPDICWTSSFVPSDPSPDYFIKTLSIDLSRNRLLALVNKYQAVVLKTDLSSTDYC